MTQALVFQIHKNLDWQWGTLTVRNFLHGTFRVSIDPGGGLHSTTSDMLKFLSANMGLIKTKLNDAMQESHLIRHSTGQLLPNNLQASDKVITIEIGVYVGLGWFITTNFGHEIIWHNGATIGGYNAYMAFNPVTERGIVILCSTHYSRY